MEFKEQYEKLQSDLTKKRNEIIKSPEKKKKVIFFQRALRMANYNYIEPQEEKFAKI